MPPARAVHDGERDLERFDPEPEPPRERTHTHVLGREELRAGLRVPAASERIADRQHAAADAVARLEDDDLEAGPCERIRGGETREPGADDDDTPSGRPRAMRGMSSVLAATPRKRRRVSVKAGARTR